MCIYILGIMMYTRSALHTNNYFRVAQLFAADDIAEKTTITTTTQRTAGVIVAMYGSAYIPRTFSVQSANKGHTMAPIHQKDAALRIYESPL